MHQLLLQADRVGRDDDAGRFFLVVVIIRGKSPCGRCLFLIFRRFLPPFTADGQNRGNEIRKALADAGACLDGKMMMLGQRTIDRLGHRKLLAAMLVVYQTFRDSAIGAKYFLGGEHTGQDNRIAREKSGGGWEGYIFR